MTFTVWIDHAYEGEKQLSAVDKADADRIARETFAAGTPLKGFGVMIENGAGEIVERFER